MKYFSRFSAEEKIYIVEKYLRGEISANAAIVQMGISNNTFARWVRLYKISGPAGLEVCKTPNKYSPELKKAAVKAYLSGKGSLDDICLEYKITAQSLLSQWVERYNSQENTPKKASGGKGSMAVDMHKRGRKTTYEERIEIVTFLMAQNNNYAKTMEKYNISYHQAYSWLRKYKAEGVEGLIDRRSIHKKDRPTSELEILRAELKLKATEVYQLQMENDLLKKLELLERRRAKN